MKNFSKYDFSEHFEKNKKIYLVLLLCLILGIVFGIFVAVSKTSYLGLLNVKDKNIINIINGVTLSASEFWKNMFSFLMPLILVLLFSLNYYLNIASFVVFIYQSTLLFLTSLALVSTYGFLGLIKVIIIILPINILYFCVFAYFIAVCSKRAGLSQKLKCFSAGFDNDFWTKIIASFLSVIAIDLIVYLILPLLLKSAIFIIF